MSQYITCKCHFRINRDRAKVEARWPYTLLACDPMRTSSGKEGCKGRCSSGGPGSPHHRPSPSRTGHVPEDRGLCPVTGVLCRVLCVCLCRGQGMTVGPLLRGLTGSDCGAQTQPMPWGVESVHRAALTPKLTTMDVALLPIQLCFGTSDASARLFFVALLSRRQVSLCQSHAGLSGVCRGLTSLLGAHRVACVQRRKESLGTGELYHMRMSQTQIGGDSYKCMYVCVCVYVCLDVCMHTMDVHMCMVCACVFVLT